MEGKNRDGNRLTAMGEGEKAVSSGLSTLLSFLRKEESENSFHQISPLPRACVPPLLSHRIGFCLKCFPFFSFPGKA